MEAEIVADKLYIAGEICGNITARSHLEITETGKVYGDIFTSNLVVGQGVIFEGRCHMISPQDELESQDFLSEAVPLLPSSSSG